MSSSPPSPAERHPTDGDSAHEPTKLHSSSHDDPSFTQSLDSADGKIGPIDGSRSWASSAGAGWASFTKRVFTFVYASESWLP